MFLLNECEIKKVKCNRPSGIKPGPLKMPDGCNMQLVAFGENDDYLLCVFSDTGVIYQVFKDESPYHIYHHILKLNGVSE